MTDDSILNLDDLLADSTDAPETVDFTCWGRKVRLASVSADGLVKWAASGKEHASLRLVVLSLVDGQGNRVPEDKVESTISALLRKDRKQNKIAIDEATKLNGIDEMIKNLADSKNDSGEAPTSASPTV